MVYYKEASRNTSILNILQEIIHKYKANSLIQNVLPTKSKSSSLITVQHVHPRICYLLYSSRRSDIICKSASLVPRLLTYFFHAEQVAILNVIQFVQQNYINGSFLIISDSLSALLSFTISFQSVSSTLPILYSSCVTKI